MPTVELQPAGPDDREYVERLLAGNDLPTADLDAAYRSLFVCEAADADRVGVGGLEVADDAKSVDAESGNAESEAAAGESGDAVGIGGGGVGLLRSVAVEESARGAGYGTAICEHLLDRARAAELDAVFLLTTTAEDFFADLGFEMVEREQVPEPVRQTAEFTDLCPASATCMKLDLPRA